jgi:hypothetical protein
MAITNLATTNEANAHKNNFTNQILHGDCIEAMREMPANSVDFILTDPPYLVTYRDRSGRTIQNDVDENWLKPAMAEAYRVLKQDRVAIMFYGWTKIDAFFEAWRSAGFQPVGHIVFRKSYCSKSRFLRYQHEQAFLLAKGRPKERLGRKTAATKPTPAMSVTALINGHTERTVRKNDSSCLRTFIGSLLFGSAGSAQRVAMR